MHSHEGIGRSCGWQGRSFGLRFLTKRPFDHPCLFGNCNWRLFASPRAFFDYGIGAKQPHPLLVALRLAAGPQLQVVSSGIAACRCIRGGYGDQSSAEWRQP